MTQPTTDQKPLDNLVGFMTAVTRNLDLEDRLATAETEADVVALAEAEGFAFSAEDLNLAVAVATELVKEQDAQMLQDFQTDTLVGRLGLVLFSVRMLALKRHDR